MPHPHSSHHKYPHDGLTLDLFETGKPDENILDKGISDQGGRVVEQQPATQEVGEKVDLQNIKILRSILGFEGHHHRYYCSDCDGIGFCPSCRPKIIDFANRMIIIGVNQHGHELKPTDRINLATKFVKKYRSWLYPKKST